MWEVTVGNIGTVYRGKADVSQSLARMAYSQYVSLSKMGAGRAGGEDVTLWEDGEPVAEYAGSMREDS